MISERSRNTRKLAAENSALLAQNYILKCILKQKTVVLSINWAIFDSHWLQLCTYLH